MDRAEMTLSQEIHALSDRVADAETRSALHNVADRVDLEITRHHRLYVEYRDRVKRREQLRHAEYKRARKRAPVLASGANASATNHAGARTQ